MTKFEQEISEAFYRAMRKDHHLQEDPAKVAAEVAKKYIEKAWDSGFEWGDFANGGVYDPLPLRKVEWLKENGIIE